MIDQNQEDTDGIDSSTGMSAVQGTVERYRAVTGLLGVIVGDLVIAIAAIVAVLVIHNDGTNATAIVSILTSAFTAVGTLTTAYFGIRAASNTAQTSLTTNQNGAG